MNKRSFNFYYIMPLNTIRKFEFFAGFGLKELITVLIIFLISMAIFFITKNHFEIIASPFGILIFVIPTSITFYIVKRDINNNSIVS